MKHRFVTSCAVLLLMSLLAFGSLAYFTASDRVINRFSVAGSGSDVEPDRLFSLRLYETDGNSQTEVGLHYRDIVPGQTVKKDPTVENTGRYDQWIRVYLTVTNAANWEDCCNANGIDFLDIFRGLNRQTWTVVGSPTRNYQEDTLTYVFYLKHKLAPGETMALFDAVTIPREFGVEEMVALSSFQMILCSDAIQADHTGDSAQEAFEAYWN